MTDPKLEDAIVDFSESFAQLEADGLSLEGILFLDKFYLRIV